ncbi:hypothetical protein NM688_g4140 [Phlebia brevispora]|uniref:Uncharacterized protein n=1 Tax=Phlebia brevispora TaxID=194682 RepID=A0ACC1T3H3_9APHY|nr:hypothetical protein NM688_g4140 [Phlebia brevispora]
MSHSNGSLSHAGPDVPEASKSNIVSTTRTLNFDILARVMTFIDEKKHLLALMQSCCALYRAGIQPLVRLETVIKESNLPSFHAFMIKHSPASFVALHELDIYPVDEFSDAAIHLLVDLLGRSTALRRLSISGDVLDADDKVPQAVASLTTLRCLDSHGQSDTLGLVLSNLHSPIVEVRAFFCDDQEDPVSLLANFHRTLQTAYLTCVKFESIEFCYPKLTYLDLTLCYRPELSVLLRAFPNLEELHMDAGESTGRGPRDRQEILELRTRNLRFQQNRGATWESLHTIHADLDKPDVLAEAFRVGLRDLGRFDLTLQFRAQTGYQESLDALFTALTSVEALMLHLHVTMYDRAWLNQDHSDENIHPAELFFQKVDHKLIADRAFAAVSGLICLTIDTWLGTRSSWMGWEEENERGWKDVSGVTSVPQLQALIGNRGTIVRQSTSLDAIAAVLGFIPRRSVDVGCHNAAAARFPENTRRQPRIKFDRRLPGRLPTYHSTTATSPYSSETSDFMNSLEHPQLEPGHKSRVHPVEHIGCDGVSADMLSDAIPVLQQDTHSFMSTLNLDVFTVLMTFIRERKDLLSLMSTCHALYVAGVQHLIRLSTDCIPGLKLRSFHTFMLSHSPASFAALRRFSLKDDLEPAPEDVGYLTSLLKRSVRLEDLRLPSSVLNADSNLPLVVASLKSLVSLHFVSTSPAVESTLLLLHSPLKALNVSFSDHEQDPIPFLAEFQHTLEKASLTHVNIMHPDFGFTKLTELELIHCILPRLSVLMVAFPNLTALTLLDQGDGTVVVLAHAIRQQVVRPQNIAFQANGHHWKSLRSLTTNTFYLYTLGLQRKLDVLKITDPMLGDPDYQFRRFLPSIVPLQPREISLSLHDHDFAPGVHEDHFRKIFAVGMDRLVRLEVSFGFDMFSGYAENLNMLFGAIEGLNLSIFELSLWVRTTRWPSGRNRKRRHPTEEFLEELSQNVDTLYRRAVRAVRTLDVVVCTVKPSHQPSTRKTWVASEEGDNKVYREFNASKAGEGECTETVITVTRDDYSIAYTVRA